MFMSRPFFVSGLPACVAAVAIAAAVSFAPPPALGFGLKDVAGGPQDNTEKSLLRQELEWEADQARGKLAEKAADQIEKAGLKAGKKAWDRLEKSKTFGPAARKMTARYGAAVAKGIAVTPKARAVLGAWETGAAIGGAIAPLAVAWIDRYYDGKWKEQQEQLARETAHLRKLGEQRREHKENLSNLLAVGAAMRMLQEDRERAKAAADPWGGAGLGSGAKETGTGDDPWVPEPSARTSAARPAVEADDGGDQGSNYENALKGLPGSASSASYQHALEKLEADRRAERARRKAEAEEARRRAAAAERHRQAEREKARKAAARERQQASERAARQRREASRRAYEESVRQLNRNIQTLQQTRQRQQQLEQARRQRMEEQRRARERQRRAYERQRQAERQYNEPRGRLCWIRDVECMNRLR